MLRTRAARPAAICPRKHRVARNRNRPPVRHPKSRFAHRTGPESPSASTAVIRPTCSERRGRSRHSGRCGAAVGRRTAPGIVGRHAGQRLAAVPARTRAIGVGKVYRAAVAPRLGTTCPVRSRARAIGTRPVGPLVERIRPAHSSGGARCGRTPWRRVATQHPSTWISHRSDSGLEPQARRPIVPARAVVGGGPAAQRAVGRARSIARFRVNSGAGQLRVGVVVRPIGSRVKGRAPTHGSSQIAPACASAAEQIAGLVMGLRQPVAELQERIRRLPRVNRTSNYSAPPRLGLLSSSGGVRSAATCSTCTAWPSTESGCNTADIPSWSAPTRAAAWPGGA